MKKILMMASAVAVSGVTVSAGAFELELLGQVNKAIVNIDDGHNNETSIVDNDFSSTRMGLKGEQELANGLTASVFFEFHSESSSSVNVGASRAFDVESGASGVDQSFEERHSRVGLAGNFGAVFLGHTSIASDAVIEMDIAGVGNMMGSDVEDIGGGAIVDTTGNVRFNQAAHNFDRNRTNVIAYYSPKVNGAQLAASVDDDTNIDLALRYRGAFETFKMRAGFGYTKINDHLSGHGINDDDGRPSHSMGGSVTFKHQNGIGATAAYAVQEFAEANRTTATNFYGKLGYTFDKLELAVDYTLSEHIRQNDDELAAYGVGAQYNLGDGVSVAGLYRHVTFDRVGSTTENDVDIFAAGLRVRF